MNRLDSIEGTQLRQNIPEFQSGDTVRVHVRIKESETKERLQAFEGVVIARKHGGSRETITVRKTSFGIGVERIFPLHATIVDHIDVVKRGRVRRPSFTICAHCVERQRVFASATRVANKALPKRPQLRERSELPRNALKLTSTACFMRLVQVFSVQHLSQGFSPVQFMAFD